MKKGSPLSRGIGRTDRYVAPVAISGHPPLRAKESAEREKKKGTRSPDVFARPVITLVQPKSGPLSLASLGYTFPSVRAKFHRHPALDMAGTMIALMVSTLYIALTSLIAYWMRRYVGYYVGEPFVKALFLESIATAELCGACFELIVVAENWGVSVYAIYLFVLTVWWSSSWGDASACPYTHIEDAIEGKKSLRAAFLLIWAELLGGLAVFRYVQLLWALEIVSTHKSKAFEDCTTDLQVPVIVGALVECAATCVCRIVSRGLAELEPRFGTILDAFVGTSMVVAAFDYSGGYFNPALASALKYGCLGTSAVDHFIVYWVGAIVGSVGALRLGKMPFIRNYIERRKDKVD